VRTTALIAAFIPGESPPDVKTPIFVTFLSKTCKINYVILLKGAKSTHLRLLIYKILFSATV
jgi:hypothetical protein